MARTLLAAAAALLAVPASASASAWRWPARAPVVAAFHLPARPYGAGGHRGIDIAAPAGATVRAACRGRVRFAGTVGSSGLVVSVACDGVVATYVGLGSAAVRSGAFLRAGDRIGTAGRDGLHLGARSATGYVDPLTLLGAAGRSPPVAPPPARVRHRAPPTPARFAPPIPARAPAPRAPLVAWLGVVLVGLAAPGLGARHVLRRRRRRAAGVPGRAAARQ